MKVAAVTSTGTNTCNKPERLGVAGLALHYAHIITQMDNIVSARYSFRFEVSHGWFCVIELM